MRSSPTTVAAHSSGSATDITPARRGPLPHTLGTAPVSQAGQIPTGQTALDRQVAEVSVRQARLSMTSTSHNPKREVGVAPMR